LKAVPREGQSSVAAGLALCAASAGPRIRVLLPCWSHTVETHRARAEPAAAAVTTLRICYVLDVANQGDESCKFRRPSQP